MYNTKSKTQEYQQWHWTNNIIYSGLYSSENVAAFKLQMETQY